MSVITKCAVCNELVVDATMHPKCELAIVKDLLYQIQIECARKNAMLPEYLIERIVLANPKQIDSWQLEQATAERVKNKSQFQLPMI